MLLLLLLLIIIYFYKYLFLPLNDLCDIAETNKTCACVITKVINFEFVFFFNIISTIL